MYTRKKQKNEKNYQVQSNSTHIIKNKRCILLFTTIIQKDC